ncbi:MAG TPA: bifunctional phosphopantothenoylcysteine decarboxylase/phosphopantothenate--cysteine ligase CoaBC [Burkholderiales bacterium]|nr:bifunctional phosphopantothenoylcysteine decarboxylase/phosphopantothenate--cysteine ligase CoaBC [Burkholderiales bacterium]
MHLSHPRRFLVGVTGGIAAYKVAELTRLMMQEGCEVEVVMTEAAMRFVGPATFQALTGKPVFSDLWDPRAAGGMAHIELSRNRDAIVIAPASADFIAKLAHGFADDLLAALCLAREVPLIVAPAMNRQMWEHPATQRNVATLTGDGVIVLGPATGEQACGETGMGRLLEPEDLLQGIIGALQPKRLAGKHVLVTAGPTSEAIDPVRVITNLSSGKMGYALARAAHEAGARVTLISGRTCLTPPFGVTRIDVSSALDMFECVKAHLAGADVFASVAAVADYRAARPATQKIKKRDQPATVELTPNPDILGYVASLPNAPFCVGFAAETELLEEHAQAKRRAKKVPLLAANLVRDGLGTDDNTLILFDETGRHELARAGKLDLARQIVAHVARLLHTTPAAAPAVSGESAR